MAFLMVEKNSRYFENGDETSGSIKCVEFLYYLRICARRTRLSELSYLFS
jgi:hypothetical protein